jgi:hypothetical protein
MDTVSGSEEVNGRIRRPGKVRRVIGLILMVLSPVFTIPLVSQIWERPAHFNLGGLITVLCFPALTVGLLFLGGGLVSDRKKLLIAGGLISGIAVATYATMAYLYLTSNM